ncbi:hypothetical protein GN958_ATG06670 [Phytophthora infestans]|uniref:RxLR effector PexRD54 WY domain-containing protein n=1 Tax=Phytophthora infestans TaxID=4787 RepID=A0A8S9UTU3_PHYIN|nr:hypothetical protein GN958_ATG06670 [Phytophthora infestans]
MIDMFSNTYQDDGAAKMIEMGKKSLNMETRKIASRLQQELVKKWVDNAESPDAVFELLKLDKAGFDLFRSPLVNTFYAFLKKDMAWGIEDRMLRTLIGKYGYAGLSKIFILGEPRIDLLGRLPMKLENRMVSKWLDNDISPDKVFELLQLNKGLDRLLTDPNLMMWQSYRVMFNSKRGVDATTTMHTITKFYKSQDVSAMLEKAKNVPATAKIATRWQHELKVQKLRGAKIKKEG